MTRGRRPIVRRVLLVVALAAAAPGTPFGQGRGVQQARSPKEAAPVDLTGYWVSVISEDWRWRMVTPLKGDSASVPINREAKAVVDAWDPAKDEAAGLQCKAYGAPAIMRMPGRLRINWQDDQTLKIEADSGTQTRLFHFGGKPPQRIEATWQGYSTATWEGSSASPGTGVGFGVGLGPRQGARSRSLQVATTNLRAGYLRKNGVPYSERTTLTEYFERFSEPGGDERLTVMAIVTDPQYLAVPFVTTSDFKKEPDGAKWDPTPCSAK